MELAIVIPVYRDDENLRNLLAQLNQVIPAASKPEIVVVNGDAEDCDETAALCQKYGTKHLVSPRGRGRQISKGLDAVASSCYWILHADTVLTDASVTRMLRLALDDAPCWGRFNVHIPGLGWLAWMMNTRSRITKICTGDQGMFFHSVLVETAGGFPAQALMEDIEMSKRLKRGGGAFVCCSERIVTSPRRWRVRGVVPTILAMWAYRLRYWLGADADKLFTSYYRSR